MDTLSDSSLVSVFNLPVFPKLLQSEPIGGRLTYYLQNWELITQDVWVLNTISQGHQWEFLEKPPLARGQSWLHCPKSSQHLPALRQKLQHFLDIGAVEKVVDPTSPGFYSRFFVLPKKTPGQWRAILDLKALNEYIVAPKFKMETAESIRRDLSQSNWTTSIDLVDAYLHIPVHQSFRPYLRFVVDGVAYQYKALPAGLSTAPWAFTRVISVIKAFLHRMGINLHQYIDDWLIRALTHQLCLAHTGTAMFLTRMLGFIPHMEKSQLDPVQIFLFLGYLFNLILGMVMPTQERWVKIQHIVRLFCQSTSLPARMWQRLLGLLAATERLVPQGLLRMRPIQIYLRQNWHQHSQSQNYPVPVSLQIKQHLQWWLGYHNVMTGIPIVSPEPQLEIFTDASLFGWGAHLDRQVISGVWTEDQSLLHINWLEMEAVRLALLHFQAILPHKVVLIASDNTTVVAYINRQGGTKSDTLYQLVEKILVWCQYHHIVLRARHIPGNLNVLADLLSRRHQIIPTEWQLHSGIFQVLCRLWDTPHIDLFATYFNNQLPVYMSPMPDAQAYAIDALSTPWTGMWAYAFPPIPLLAKVLAKIRYHQCQVILVAPWWPKQSWFPDLLQLSIDHPRRLPNRPDLLSQSQGHMWHPTPQLLHLHAWRLSGVLSESRDFQLLQRNSLLSHIDNPLQTSMSLNGKSTHGGVVNGILIQSIPLSNN